MKRFIFTFINLILIWISVQGQSFNYLEINNLRYRIMSEADGASTFGTVCLVSGEFEPYEGDINVPIAIKENNETFSDTYKVIGIDDDAFKNAKKLRSVTLPPSIEFIGNNSFADSSLDSIFIPMGNLESIGHNAFARCNISSIDIPSSVKRMGVGVFKECKTLRNAVLKNGLVHLGDSAFYGCYNLRECILPETLTRIEAYSFYGCVNVANIIFSSNLKKIGDRAFTFCMSLRELTIPKTVVQLGEYAFSHTGLSTIIIPEKIRILQKGTFYNSKMLRRIVLPKTLELIKQDALYGTKLYSINIPNTTQIEYGGLFGSDTLFVNEKLDSLIHLNKGSKPLKIKKEDTCMLPIIDDLKYIRDIDKQKIYPTDYRAMMGGIKFLILAYPDEKYKYGVLRLMRSKDYEDGKIPNIIEITGDKYKDKFIVVCENLNLSDN